MPSASGKPLIAVTGATGLQGGSVVKYLLEDGGFRVRAITRKVDSPKAQELLSKGVEVVKADADDVDSLKEAFKDAYGVYGLTNFWEYLSEEREIQQGKNLVDAAKAAGVKHFVWSTLDHTDKPYLSHWCGKAKVDDYLKESGIPRTSLYTSFYYENFLNLMPLGKTEEGKALADWPVLMTDGPIGGYAVTETGAYVVIALKNPEEWIDKDMRIISDVFTPRQLVKVLSEESGKEIVLKEVDRASFDAVRSPQTEEIWCNMEWFYNHDGNPNRDLELTKRIYPARKTMPEFVKENKDALLAVLSS